MNITRIWLTPSLSAVSSMYIILSYWSIKMFPQSRLSRLWTMYGWVIWRIDDRFNSENLLLCKPLVSCVYTKWDISEGCQLLNRKTWDSLVHAMVCSSLILGKEEKRKLLSCRIKKVGCLWIGLFLLLDDFHELNEHLIRLSKVKIFWIWYFLRHVFSLFLQRFLH